MMFNVDWNWFVQTLMPEWWRRPRMIAFLRVLLSPVAFLHGLFLAFRNGVIYDLTHTGQTMSLEHALNDRFDPEQRRIYIENKNDLTQIYIYRKIEERPAPYLYRKWVSGNDYSEGDRVSWQGSVWEAVSVPSDEPGVDPAWEFYAKTFRLIRKGEARQPYDFIVWVPATLVLDLFELRAIVDTYRSGGKRYTIQTY